LPITKHFPVKLQLLLIRVVTIEYALNRQLTIPRVTAWCSVFQSCKPLSLFTLRFIVILHSFFIIGSCVSVFYFFMCRQFFKNNFSRCVGFASSLTKLWLERWLVGLCQCACKYFKIQQITLSKYNYLVDFERVRRILFINDLVLFNFQIKCI